MRRAFGVIRIRRNRLRQQPLRREAELVRQAVFAPTPRAAIRVTYFTWSPRHPQLLLVENVPGEYDVWPGRTSLCGPDRGRALFRLGHDRMHFSAMLQKRRVTFRDLPLVDPGAVGRIRSERAVHRRLPASARPLACAVRVSPSGCGAWSSARAGQTPTWRVDRLGDPVEGCLVRQSAVQAAHQSFSCRPGISSRGTPSPGSP
jgi:hypothetical protein